VTILNRLIRTGHRADVKAIVRSLLRAGYTELRPYWRATFR
jgi:hypothetical protein